MPLSRAVVPLQTLLGRAGRALGLARVSSTPAPGSMDRGNVISHKDMKVLVDSGNARIIDVRLPGEVANGHIANSVNIPVAEVEEALKMDPETFKMKYGVDKPRMDDESLIFHCQMGRRGAQATEIAINLGYTKARNYTGGYKEWSEKEVK
ncbi:thiosulfate:glutathione sulfurtransferase-like isoform X1 [Gopherus flavomarginatus]|uniref:thiosulfate:glutathione sulfurtransferase-like isoform X1 n=1 Tax=Gopherus flavomarginatus TaxID=286002 RepID=UPI0021CC21B1|nr:thiosulfate:glutathione sulfurtransferase-like isoform X1 [Gopherus flavomarginatus]